MTEETSQGTLKEYQTIRMKTYGLPVFCRESITVTDKVTVWVLSAEDQ